MAQLKYCDKHNQVGFLFKPAESAGYTEIVDFLRRSKLRYALTHNPPVYDSLVKQFWQTATARTLADGTQQLNATIDSSDRKLTDGNKGLPRGEVKTTMNSRVGRLAGKGKINSVV
ncbi:hypothetical protein Tco_0720929 [Tanacetum coccineum]